MGSEERWLKITSGFCSDSLGPQQISSKLGRVKKPDEIGNSNSKLSKSKSVEFYDPSIKIQSNHEAITNSEIKIKNLEALLEVKSKIISEQNSVIKALTKEVHAHSSSSEVKTDSDAIKIKLNKIGESRSVRKNHNISQIEARVQELESRMDKLVNSLPSKMNLVCAQYMSNCKFKWEESESGEFFVIPSNCPHTKSKPWSKTPSIQPKLNNSSKMRQSSVQSHVTQNQNAGHIDSINDDAQQQMKRLENIVSELKVEFIRLLIDKLTTQRKCQNNKNSDKADLTRFENLLRRF